MAHAIERIRAHGLRTAALTNNWAATDGRRAAPNGYARSAFDVVVESAVEGLRKPDPRIYELVLARLDVRRVREPCSSTTSASTSSRRARWA